MLERRLAVFAAPLVFVPLIAQACSPAVPPPVIQQVTSASAAPPKHDGPDSPARWALAPTVRWNVLARVSTGNGTLDVGGGGERWLQSGADRQPAATLLPGTIVGATKEGNGYLFLLADGSVYGASEPLGPATRMGAPRPNVSVAAAGKASVLLVDGTGTLLRSVDHGKTYAKVSLGQPEGIVRDVAMSGTAGLALATPQRLLVTKDDGATWAPIPSPSEEGLESVYLQDGELRVSAGGTDYGFDPATSAFKALTTTRVARSQEEIAESVRVVDGKHGLVITGRPYAAKREWTLTLGELTAMPAEKAFDELTGCDSVSAAMRGDVIEVACDARGTIDGGVDKVVESFEPGTRWNTRRRYNKTALVPADGGAGSGTIVRLLRSEDGGKTFKEDGVLDGAGTPKDGTSGIAIGDGGWVYLTERCITTSYDPTCRAPRVRANAAAAFADLSSDPAHLTVRFTRFASNVKSSDVYALGTDDDGVAIYKFKAGTTSAEKVVDVAKSVNEPASTLTLDDDGTVRGFVNANDGPRLFSIKAGASNLTAIASPSAGSLRAALAGKWALAIGDKAYETSDEGKTWVAVTKPSGAVAVEQCSAYGCATSRGFRAGWDGAETQPVTDSPVKNVFAKALKCTAQGRWTKLGGGSLATIEDVDVGNARWLLPTRDEAGRVTVHVNKRGDSITKTSDVVLTGPALQPPKFGAETVMHVQANGVVVRRYTYSKIRPSPGVYNPVDATLTWYRGDTGKVFHGAVSKIPPFRVQHDPRFDYEEMSPYAQSPEMVWLDARGVYFLAASYEDDRPMYLLRDDGRVDKQKAPETPGDSSGIVQVGPDLGLAGVLTDAISTHWVQRDKTFVWRSPSGSVSLFDFGGRPSEYLSADTAEASYAWAIPLKPELDPSEWFALPTQKSLGDQPRACDAPPVTDGSAFRYFAPYFKGTRHPLSVDVDGAPVVLATDRAAVRGSTKAPGDACVSALEAVTVGDSDVIYSGLVFPDDLSHSLIFSVNKSDPWPEAISFRAMDCAYSGGGLPEELKETAGFYVGDLPVKHVTRDNGLEGFPPPRPLYKK